VEKIKKEQKIFSTSLNVSEIAEVNEPAESAGISSKNWKYFLKQQVF